MIRSLFIFAISLFINQAVLAQAWTPCGVPPNSIATYASDVCVHNGKLFAITSASGLIVSTDNGESWTTVNSELTSNSGALYSTGDRLYVVMTNSGCSYIQYSEDEGETFVVDSEGLPACYDGAVTQPSAGGVSWQNHLLFSLAGPDWEFSRNTSESGWVDASYFDENDCSEFFVKNDTCWAATNGATSNGVAWSVDGINWTSPACAGIGGFFVPGQIGWINHRLMVMPEAGNDASILFSDDYGMSFEEVSISQYLDPYVFFTLSGYQPTLNLYSGNGAVYLALGNDALESAPELIVSYDEGLTFEKDTVGFPFGVLGSNFSIRNMAFLNGWSFALVNNGDLYRKQLNPNSISEFGGKDNFISVYPNPMMNEIRIETERSFGNQVYQILDVSGRVMIQGRLEGATTLVNVTDLTSGVYFLHLVESNETVKLIKVF